MPREKGTPKTGGKVKGSPASHVADSIKAKLGALAAKYVLSGDVRGLEKDLDALRPVDRVAAYEKFFKYIIPTLGSVAVKNGEGAPLEIVVSYAKSKPKKDEDFSDIDYSEADDLPDEDEIENDTPLREDDF